MIDGILLIDKPKGWTSFDVVAKVRGVLKQSSFVKPKVGHTGTLDPLATGLLVLLVGNYTKKAPEFSQLDKTYEAIIELGANSSTGDAEGNITKISEDPPNLHKIEDIIDDFIGNVTQIPPIHSAIKIDGQRAYKLARAGKKVEMKPRNVVVHNLEIKRYNYPLLEVVAHVSSGTYIRSLAQDIGEKLGSGGYVKELKRTQAGKYLLSDALNLKKISAQTINNHIKK